MVNDFFNDLDEIFTSSGYVSSGYKPLSPKDYKTSSDEDGITLSMNVPGYNKKTIDITVDDDKLVIAGKPNTGDTEGFEKRFDIGEKLDVEEIEATVLDGVLTVSIPYYEEVKSRKIEVKVT